MKKLISFSGLLVLTLLFGFIVGFSCGNLPQIMANTGNCSPQTPQEAPVLHRHRDMLYKADGTMDILVRYSMTEKWVGHPLVEFVGSPPLLDRGDDDKWGTSDDKETTLGYGYYRIYRDAQMRIIRIENNANYSYILDYTTFVYSDAGMVETKYTDKGPDGKWETEDDLKQMRTVYCYDKPLSNYPLGSPSCDKLFETYIAEENL